jgi:hypothetical protein
MRPVICESEDNIQTNAKIRKMSQEAFDGYNVPKKVVRHFWYWKMQGNAIGENIANSIRRSPKSVGHQKLLWHTRI